MLEQVLYVIVGDVNISKAYAQDKQPKRNMLHKECMYVMIVLIMINIKNNIMVHLLVFASHATRNVILIIMLSF